MTNATALSWDCHLSTWPQFAPPAGHIAYTILSQGSTAYTIQQVPAHVGTPKKLPAQPNHRLHQETLPQ